MEGAKKNNTKNEKLGSAGDDGKSEKADFSLFFFPSQCPPRAFVSIFPRLLALTFDLSPFPSPYEKEKQRPLRRREV